MANLEKLIASLHGMGVDGLRRVWRDQLREELPSIRAGDILRRALAEKLQEQALGADLELHKQLNALAARYKPGRKPTPPGPTYRSGVHLTKDWNGTRHEVEVVDGGYVWNGQRHKSLSAIAREITGVRWNGPRFFGLRQASR